LPKVLVDAAVPAAVVDHPMAHLLAVADQVVDLEENDLFLPSWKPSILMRTAPFLKMS
jgi:hypothetical protein